MSYITILDEIDNILTRSVSSEDFNIIKESLNTLHMNLNGLLGTRVDVNKEQADIERIKEVISKCLISS
jgi:hypothetical protein